MSPVGRLARYVFRYRRHFVLGLGSVIISRAIALASPTVLGYAVDGLRRGVTTEKLLAYGGILLAIGVVGGVFQFLIRRILIGASRHIEYDMRNDFFAHLEKLPLAYFQTHRTGDLMSRATNDLSAVRMMIGPAIMYSTSTLLTFVVALGRMLSIDRRLTLIALIPLPFVSISVKYFGSAIHKRFEQIQAQLSDISAVVQESLSGVRVVRAYRQEAQELERFRRSNQEYLDRNRGLIVLQGFFFPSMSFFLSLGALLVLWLGSREVIRGRITLGEFVAFNAYLTMLSWPMIAFGWVTNMLQRGMASWKRMLEVLETEPSIADDIRPKADTIAASTGPVTDGATSATSPGIATATVAVQGTDPGTNEGATTVIRGPSALAFEHEKAHWTSIRPLHAIRGEIEFRDLVFTYGGGPVLNHVSARIAAGQTVALVGATGSGKSTLIGLLARLHEPPRGTVFIDGVDVREIPLPALRGAIGFVPQEPFLFSDTLANNVAFGLDAVDAAGEGMPSGWAVGIPDAAAAVGWSSGTHSVDAGPPGDGHAERMRRILDAAAVARLDKDVAAFPKGYDTMIGERGITLSGGQKQRTAIARAVVLDPRILILDDALSAVDTYTEEEILARLRDVMRQRTSIIVSHRISTVRDADQIFVLDEGQIVERGVHDELIGRDGPYATLHKKQLLEEELAAS